MNNNYFYPYFSNDLELLANKMIENILTYGKLNPFNIRYIVIPNHNIENWLKLYITKQIGYFTGITFITFADFLKLESKNCGIFKKIVNKKDIEQILFELFLNDNILNEQDFIDLKYYFGNCKNKNYWYKIYQLADKLSRYYQDYMLYRSEMLELWSNNKFFLDNNNIEKWQQKLWLILINRFVLNNMITFSDFYELLKQNKTNNTDCVYFFGFSQIASSYINILYLISKQKSIYYYGTLSCQESIEDVKNIILKDKEQNEYLLDIDCMPLQLWGIPAREGIKLFAKIFGNNFNYEFLSNNLNAHTVLAKFQQDILNRQVTYESSTKINLDKSIIFIESPNIRREVETIYEQIFTCLYEDNTIKLKDIAIIINANSIEKYLPHIKQVFADDIPYSIFDLSFNSCSQVIEAFKLLLEIPSANYSRKSVLDFVFHNIIIEQFNNLDKNIILNIIDELNIIEGINKQDFVNTFVNNDLYNWEQGIKRVALGHFVSIDKDIIININNQSYNLISSKTNNINELAKIFNFILNLILDLKYLYTSELTTNEWIINFNKIFDIYFPTKIYDQNENIYFYKLYNLLNNLKNDTNLKLNWYLIKNIILTELLLQDEAIEYSNSSAVWVASFRPMRPLPFKVVCMLGMNEGVFPSAELNNPLDLRQKKRLLGDIKPREQDKAMFLEILMSIKNKIFISWIAKDLRKNAELSPSSVVCEFMTLLQMTYVNKIETIKPKLRRHEDVLINDFVFNKLLLEEYRVHQKQSEIISIILQNNQNVSNMLFLFRKYNNTLYFNNDINIIELFNNIKNYKFNNKQHISIKLKILEQYLKCPLQAIAKETWFKNENIEHKRDANLIPIELQNTFLVTNFLETNFVDIYNNLNLLSNNFANFMVLQKHKGLLSDSFWYNKIELNLTTEILKFYNNIQEVKHIYLNYQLIKFKLNQFSVIINDKILPSLNINNQYTLLADFYVLQNTLVNNEFVFLQFFKSSYFMLQCYLQALCLSYIYKFNITFKIVQLFEDKNIIPQQQYEILYNNKLVELIEEYLHDNCEYILDYKLAEIIYKNNFLQYEDIDKLIKQEINNDFANLPIQKCEVIRWNNYPINFNTKKMINTRYDFLSILSENKEKKSFKSSKVKS